MSSWVKTLATKPNELSSVPGPYMVGEEKQFLQAILWSHACNGICNVHVCGKVGNKDIAADLVTVMCFQNGKSSLGLSCFCKVQIVFLEKCHTAIRMGSAVKWASINSELTLFSWFLLISYFMEDYFRSIFLLCKSSHIFVFFPVWSN